MTAAAAPRSALIVEDAWIVAQGLRALLGTLDIDVVGPAGTVSDALELARTATPTFALVDLNLRGQRADAVVDCLLARQVPVILASGYARDMLPARFAALPLCNKPYKPDMLLELIATELDRVAVPGGEPP